MEEFRMVYDKKNLELVAILKKDSGLENLFPESDYLMKDEAYPEGEQGIGTNVVCFFAHKSKGFVALIMYTRHALDAERAGCTIEQHQSNVYPPAFPERLSIVPQYLWRQDDLGRVLLEKQENKILIVAQFLYRHGDSALEVVGEFSTAEEADSHLIAAVLSFHEAEDGGGTRFLLFKTGEYVKQKNEYFISPEALGVGRRYLTPSAIRDQLEPF